MPSRPRPKELPLPSLMRGARDVYRDAIRRALANAGCDDVPPNSTLTLTELDRSEPEPKFTPQADVVASLHLSKQAASQLIDTLVLRQYLERRTDPEDRRRMELRLTSRGCTAASAVQKAIDTIDAALAQRITADELHGLRAGLTAFRKLHDQS